MLGVPRRRGDRAAWAALDGFRAGSYLEAIDYLREGSYVSGLRVLLGPDYNAPKIDEVADLMRHARKGHHYSYRNDAAGFKAGLRAVAAVLKERGL